MSRSDNRFGGYRGRRTLTDILRLIAIVLAVLVVVVLAALFWGQDYIVYTDDGIRLELPFLPREEGKEPLPDPGEVSYTELPAGSLSEEGTTAEEPAMLALQLSVDSVLDGTAAVQLETEGANALILEMKGQDGLLRWHSEQELAGWTDANGDPAVNQALEQWNRGEIYTIARVCCFRDDRVPYYYGDMALRQGASGNWRDELGLRWMSPGSEAARSYVAALCGELAALGFDEIVLEQCAFPVRGNLEAINRGSAYNPAELTSWTRAALEQARAAVEPYDTALSLRVERDTLAGAETNSGLTAQLLEEYAARLWIEEDGLTPGLTDLMAQAGVTGDEKRLVKITAREDGQHDITQAVSAGLDAE